MATAIEDDPASIATAAVNNFAIVVVMFIGIVIGQRINVGWFISCKAKTERKWKMLAINWVDWGISEWVGRGLTFVYLE